ncbi:MAG TPA: hypothetical protein VLQ93_11105, partial [Myxococcaceae bacterium]|nr:hypothetical protein [Myxococcaceae bacterium]
MRRLLSMLMMVGALGVARAQPPAEAPHAAGGVSWTAPSGWEAQGSRPMRVATYRIAPVKGDSEPAELAIFYFGPGQGGAVEANIQRWVSQFQKPEGAPLPEKEARREKKTLGGVPVTTVDAKGTYTGGGPMMGPA